MTRLLTLLLSLSIGIFTPTSFADDNRCEELFLSIPEARSSAFSFLPKFFTERNQRAISRLAQKDLRLASIRIGEMSQVLDRLDNLSSAALLKTFILHRKVSTEITDYLKQVGREANIVSALIEAGGQKVPEHVKVLLDLVEMKFRVGFELTRLAVEAKTGSRQSTAAYDYSFRLVETIRDVIAEIYSKQKYSDYFEGIIFRYIDWNSISVKIAEQRSSQARDTKVSSNTFQAEFLELIDPALSPIQQMAGLSIKLGIAIESMPVGISYRVHELTSTVRFGPKHFYGNWSNYTSTNRAAYVRAARELGGAFEVELNIDPKKKKIIAVLLDRSHQELDPIFQSENKTGQCINTCGSFAPILFIRGGVPIISPAYATPTPVLLSLTLQRFLGFGNVKNVQFKQLSPTGAAIDIPIVLLHDGVPAAMEISIYLATLSTIGTMLFSLF